MNEQIPLKRMKFDIDEINDDVIIISNDSSTNNSKETLTKNNILNKIISTNNFSILPTTSSKNENISLKLSPKLSISPTSPDIIIDDDDIIEVASFIKNSNKFSEQKSVVSANTNPIVINLSPSASSSESHLSEKQQRRNLKRTTKNILYRWNHQYCVTVDFNASRFFEDITSYKMNFEWEFKKFNKDIWVHMSRNLQNDKTFTWKMRIRFLLHQQLLKIFPKCHLISVGSTINGCGAYNSDMDLCLCVQEDYFKFPTDRTYAIRTLRKIYRSMCSLPIVKKVITIPAKVPILKFWFNKPYEALEVDLNINNMPGIYNSYLIHYYSRIDDRFSALCLLVKHWAKKAKIADASQGTLNSYSLILMVVHFLQVACDPPILPNLQKLYPDFFANNLPLKNMTLFGELPSQLPDALENNKTVGELLIGFFKYYSNFDYQRNAISIERGCVFPRHQLPENTSRYKIFIEEPYDFQNTARCVTTSNNWFKIYRAIQKALDLFLGRNPPDIKSLLF